MSDSASGPPQIPVAVIQASLDGYLGTSIVQAFVMGIYTLLLFRTIRSALPSLLKGRHILLMLSLVVLYCLTMVNFGIGWGVTRSILILNNATRETMLLEVLNPKTFQKLQAGNGAGVVAILIADSLLVWRCYMLWSRSKIILFAFSPALLTELGLIPVLLKLNLQIGPNHIPVICLFFFISMGITVLATSLIIFRILNVSRAGGTAGRYGHVIEILVESGILYSTLLFITGVLQALTTAPLSVGEAGTYFTAVLIPVTGIAPTLISERIMTSTERDNEKWSQPVSFLKFKHSASRTGAGAGEGTTANTTTMGMNSLPFTMAANSRDVESGSLNLGEKDSGSDGGR
jgi:hypothetical protein